MILRCIKSYRMVKERSKKCYDSKTKSLKQDYLDIFEGVKSDIMCTTQYDKNSDIGTTHLGMPKVRRQDELTPEKSTNNSKLLHGTNCKILLQTGAGKSFMSRPFHFNLPSLHLLPRFVPKAKTILVGNGKHRGVLLSYLLSLIYKDTDLKYIHWSQRFMIMCCCVI